MGKWILGAAGLFAILALARPLSLSLVPPRTSFLYTLGLGLGVVASALFASLRSRGQAEQLAFYAFLTLSIDALGQTIAPFGWPAWPLFALLLAALAVAERLPLALAVAALSSLLAVADAAHADFGPWRVALGATLGYAAIVLAVHFAVLGEKRRVGRAEEELARLRYGIGQLDGEASAEAPSPALVALRHVSPDQRRARQADRAAELDVVLEQIVAFTRLALHAHAVIHLEVDRTRGVAFVRAAQGPESLVRDATVPLDADPLAFVLERRATFYATEYPRLLHALPWYRGEVKAGALLATPVKSGEVVVGVLVADRLETQSLSGTETQLLESAAALAADALARARISQSLEDDGAVFRAVERITKQLADQKSARDVYKQLFNCARGLTPFEAAAIVSVDPGQTRYTVEDGVGWPEEFRKRQVGLVERTWTAAVIRSFGETRIVNNIAAEGEGMPLLVLDEGGGRASAIVGVPLRATQHDEEKRAIGALLLMGPRGTFTSTLGRVLDLVANQAAAILNTMRALKQNIDLAAKDALTGLYNRRAFDDRLRHTVELHGRTGRSFALVMLDLDRFKKLNDERGHPAGDAALRMVADAVRRVPRLADEAARFGGEEFVVVLSDTELAGAMHLAERLREAIENAQTIFDGGRIRVTASVGLAVWPSDGKTPEELLAAADRALYAAKAAGRNRVVTAASLPMPSA